MCWKKVCWSTVIFVSLVLVWASRDTPCYVLFSEQFQSSFQTLAGSEGMFIRVMWYFSFFFSDVVLTLLVALLIDRSAFFACIETDDSSGYSAVSQHSKNIEFHSFGSAGVHLHFSLVDCCRYHPFGESSSVFIRFCYLPVHLGNTQSSIELIM